MSQKTPKGYSDLSVSSVRIGNLPEEPSSRESGHVDPDIIRGLIDARDTLISWLTEQTAPAPEQVPSLWEAFGLLYEGIEEIKRVNSFKEEGTIICGPDKR